MDILFNVNKLGLEGLGPTLTSLIKHCSRSKELKLWFLCSGIEKNDKNNIDALLELVQFEGSAEYKDFDAKKLFGHLRSLHGDWTAYGRLLVSEYIKSDMALYLDADLIIMIDVLNLKNYNFNGNLLAAVYGSTVTYALESSFFITKLKLSPETGYFNSGVVLFNLIMWRELNIESKWRNLAEQHSNELLAVDQTVLNALCKGKFDHLPVTFNVPWYPGEKKPENAEKSIIHFVGSPKPWDITGGIIHSGYKTWNAYNTYLWEKEYSRINLDKLIRTWKIRKSILKYIKKRFN